MRIFKVFIIILGVIFLLMALFSVATFFVVKHTKIKELVEHEIEEQLGISVTIENLGYSPLLTHIYAQGITIHNPAGFEEKDLAYIKAIHLVWDPLDMVILKKPTIYLCGIDLERLDIVKNKDGKVNIKELMPIKDRGGITQDNTPFAFDVLILSIGRVSFTEHTASGAKKHVFAVSIKNQTFIGLRDENKVVELIIYKAIQNTDIGKLINLTISPTLSGISDTIGAAWSTAKIGAKSAFQIAAMPFKLLFGE